MALPGHRRTSSHKRRRASHFAVKPKTLATCSKCKAPVLPHVACKECGNYAGRQAVSIKSPLDKKKATKTAKPAKAEKPAKAAKKATKKEDKAGK